MPEKASGKSSAWAASGSAGDGAGPTSGGAAGETGTFLGDEGPPSPPRSLMAFPPVARLVNLLLTSFNQLREVGPCGRGDCGMITPPLARSHLESEILGRRVSIVGWKEASDRGLPCCSPGIPPFYVEAWL